MAEILLHTKFSPPPIRNLVVSRERLAEFANSGLFQQDEFFRKLTLISAPAGYGKTSMAAEWMHGLGLPVAWLSLDEQDNDPSRFLAYFIAAIQSIHGEFGKSIQSLLQAPQRPPFEVILTLLLNEFSTLSPLSILVLDDYHTINHLSIHQQLSFMLEHLPSRVHFVVITRQDPLISLARLRAGNQVLEIRQNELRFTLEECKEFMNRVMKLDLTNTDIQALERRTEGWIAGLQLVGLSLHELQDKTNFIQGFTGSNRYILDYLMDEVVNLQSENMRDFLLNTAILERLCGPLCDTVANKPGSQEMLERLDQANMFIVPLDQSRNWYRYHRLFSDLLRHQRRLVNQPVSEAVLHQRASLWFESEGYMAEAIQHSLLAEDWPKAVQLIGEVSDWMFKHGEIVTLIGWLEKLPTELMLSNADLCMNYAWAQLLTEKYEQAKHVLAQVETLVPAGSVLLGQVATAQAYLARAIGDYPGVIVSSKLALSLLPEEDLGSRGNLLMNLGLVYWHEGNLQDAESTLIEAEKDAIGSDNVYAQLTSEIFLARTLASAGKLQAAEAKYPGIIQRGPQVPVVALAFQDLGFIHYEWNKLEKAEAYLQQGMDLSIRTRNVEFQVGGLILQVYLYLARQDWDAALKTAEQACYMASKFSAHTQSRAAAVRALVAITIGDLESASNWLEKNEEGVDSHPFYRFSGIIRPRLLIAQGKLDEAAEQLDVLYTAAKDAGWGYAQITARTLQALAVSSPDTAVDFLEDALHMAAPDGYIRTFLDAGSGLVSLLRQVAPRSKASEYARQLLSYLENKKPMPVIEKSALVEPLSARELEVLKLVTAGLSNREIGRKLFISPGTAKTHIHNLCGKLGVRNRTEAAIRAKELDLV
jgi:ATP/maltotriose-dependent transcriptional regulator MalT